MVVATGAFISIVFDWIARYSTTVDILIADVALRTSFVVLLGVVVTLQVFRPGYVTHHRVQGAIVVYLLAGIAWGYAYEIVAIVNAASFSGKLLLPFARPGAFRYTASKRSQRWVTEKFCLYHPSHDRWRSARRSSVSFIRRP